MNKVTTIVLLLTIVFSKSFSQDTLALSKYVGNLKQIAIRIKGQSYQFLFDTGGGETFISPAICTSLKKAPHGKEIGFRMNGEKNTKGQSKIDGIISLKSFQNKIICFDLANNTIMVETNKSRNKKTKEMTLWRSRFANGLTGNELNVFVGTKHDNSLFWFLFDSGNLDSFIFSPLTAYEWGIQSDSVSVGKTYETDIVFGAESNKTEVLTKEVIYDGSLNFDFISKKVYLLDMIKNQVWTR